MNQVNKAVTQNDVAKAAGVTRSMVSYVINQNSDRSVAPETRQKILQVILKNKKNYMKELLLFMIMEQVIEVVKLFNKIYICYFKKVVLVKAQEL